jgi:hypothetical protein
MASISVYLQYSIIAPPEQRPANFGNLGNNRRDMSYNEVAQERVSWILSNDFVLDNHNYRQFLRIIHRCCLKPGAGVLHKREATKSEAHNLHKATFGGYTTKWYNRCIGSAHPTIPS